MVWKSWTPHRCSQDFLREVHFSSSKKLTTFLVVALKIQAKATKLTTPTVQISPISPKNTLPLPGVHLQLSPVNLAHFFFFRPGDACAPSATPDDTYELPRNFIDDPPDTPD